MKKGGAGRRLASKFIVRSSFAQLVVLQVAKLIDAGQNVNEKDDRGFTPLHLACQQVDSVVVVEQQFAGRQHLEVWLCSHIAGLFRVWSWGYLFSIRRRFELLDGLWRRALICRRRRSKGRLLLLSPRTAGSSVSQVARGRSGVKQRENERRREREGVGR